MKKTFRVEKLVAFKARAEDGRRIGQVWTLIATKKNRATAERIMRNALIDNPDNRVRINESFTR